MKIINNCKTCDISFECAKDNLTKVGYNRFYKCPNGHDHHYDMTAESFKLLTIDEIIEQVDDLRAGRNNKYIIGNVDLKIGDFKHCRECGNITDVVAYNGCMDYDSNCSMECDCSKSTHLDDWYEPCGTDDCNEDKRCGFHEGIDVEAQRAEHQDFEERRSIVKTILEHYPPTNDGVLELDRIAYMFGGIYGKCSINDSRSWVFDDFMRYCARNGLLK